MTRNPTDAQAYATIGATIAMFLVGWIRWKLRGSFADWLVKYFYRRERRAKAWAQGFDMFVREVRRVRQQYKPAHLSMVHEQEAE